MSDFEKFMPFENRIDTKELQEKIQQAKNEIKKVIVGQDTVLDYLFVSVLAGGHTLIEGVPGVAKTVISKLLAKTIDASFSRIQFTPDLMPSDVTGTSILNTKLNEFEYIKGPIFANIVLIDEINRAPAKTQASLFECMSEKQITADGQTFILDQPFLVFATQNPVEHEGTYRLPEAQLDRFLFKVNIHYPSLENEIELLKEQQNRKNVDKESLVKAVVSKSELVSFQQLVKEVFVHEQLLNYIAQIVNKTRDNHNLSLGASPRASLAILDASKALAAISGRDFITPEDVKFVAYPIIGHRVMLTPEREMEGFSAKQIIQQIIDSVEIPR
jgi:MoxR-like ATPase